MVFTVYQLSRPGSCLLAIATEPNLVSHAKSAQEFSWYAALLRRNHCGTTISAVQNPDRINPNLSGQDSPDMNRHWYAESGSVSEKCGNIWGNLGTCCATPRAEMLQTWHVEWTSARLVRVYSNVYNYPNIYWNGTVFATIGAMQSCISYKFRVF